MQTGYRKLSYERYVAAVALTTFAAAVEGNHFATLAGILLRPSGACTL
jgi:hypothetical protein